MSTSPEFTMPSLAELRQREERLHWLVMRNLRRRKGHHLRACPCRYCQQEKAWNLLSDFLLHEECYEDAHPDHWIAPEGPVIPLGPYTLITTRSTHMPYEVGMDEHFPNAA